MPSNGPYLLIYKLVGSFWPSQPVFLETLRMLTFWSVFCFGRHRNLLVSSRNQTVQTWERTKKTHSSFLQTRETLSTLSKTERGLPIFLFEKRPVPSKIPHSVWYNFTWQFFLLRIQKVDCTCFLTRYSIYQKGENRCIFGGT